MDGPWDETGDRRPLRSFLLLAGLLVIAWLFADATAAFLAALDFNGLFRRR